ncbi:MAG: haloacid dehalogenase type II [Marmoricola sp.]
MAIRVVAFDVNETLLDLSALDDPFEALFGEASIRQQWFAQMLQLAFVGGLTGQYVDFTTAQHAALSMLAERHGRELPPDVAKSIVGAMSSLPAHPEVQAALQRLRRQPVQVVALTNSPLAVAEQQVLNAGIDDCFDALLSADEVQALKPAAAAYQHVAERQEVELEEILLVAAHPWDVSGALAAGCRAAFVRRQGVVPSPLGPAPEMIGDDITDIVDQIIEAP